jgi:hypothetical protein
MEKRDCSRARRGFGGSAALIGILLGGAAIGSPGFARAQDGARVAQPASEQAETRMRARDLRTNQLLLEGLERRRLAIDPGSASSPATLHAIEFLDSRIKLVWSRIEKDIAFFRRAS